MQCRDAGPHHNRRWCLTAAALALASCYSACASHNADHVSPPPAQVVVIPPPPGAVQRATDSAVTQTQMRNVDFHLAPALVLRIRWLRGEMVAKDSGRPVVFDDKRAFVIRLRQATVALQMDDLDHLMNDFVFAYHGSPLKHLRFSTDTARLIMAGTMHKVIDIPFTIRSSLTVTDRGQIRVHPERIKIVGLNGKGLLKALGVQLSDLLDLSGATGVRVDKNDLILDPERILPPPTIQGRLVAIHMEPGVLVQEFGGAHAAAATTASTSRTKDTGGGATEDSSATGSNASIAAADTLRPPEDVPNYMYFRGGTLRFGKLYMVHADMEILDARPSDPFEFSLDRYNEQLVAGYSRNTEDHGLLVTMPDLNALTTAGAARLPAPRVPSGGASAAGASPR